MQIRTFVEFGDVGVGGVEWLGVASAEIPGLATVGARPQLLSASASLPASALAGPLGCQGAESA
jgi:hypothetical protein